MDHAARVTGSEGEMLVRLFDVVTMPCFVLANFQPTSILSAILWAGYFSETLSAHLKILGI